jgi:DNA polymerase-1
MQVLARMGIPWKALFDNFDVHDTMVMSHAYKSDNRHGLKELAVLYCNFPDMDEKLLADITKKARNIARKYEWYLCEKETEHEELIGTDKEHFKCDYWVPEQIAIELGYPPDHEWRTICRKYAALDAERTICVFYFFVEALTGESNQSNFKHFRNRWNKKLENPEIQVPPYGIRTDTLWDKYHEARTLIQPILDMQDQKVPVDTRTLTETQELYEARRLESLAELRTLCKRPDFKPNSPKQLSDVLFNYFKFTPVKWGKVDPSTDKDVLSALMLDCDPNKGYIEPKFKFLIALKEFRKESTTLGYMKNYRNHSISFDTQKRLLQPNFRQTGTGTGRLSCIQPNTTNVGKKDMSNPFADDEKGSAQNKIRATLFKELIGVDDDDKFSLRKLFGPTRGNQWTCIDYDQFQLRIFAVVSESYDLLEGFERGEDIHSLVAKIIFQKDDISSNERTAAKAINFGLLFGAGPSKIELLAGVPGLYKMFTDNFPKAKLYLDTQSRLARSNGYVHTVGGYRLYVPRSSPHAASCYVIQGTEAEIVKNAISRIHQENFEHYKLTMMVHDELIFTSNGNYWNELNSIMKIMEDTGKEIGVPCSVDAKYTTTSWEAVEELHQTIAI